MTYRTAARWIARLTRLAMLAMTSGAWALDFASCTEPGHEAFDCASLDVPIDRAGSVPGKITLSIERKRQDGPPRPLLVALAGGPGQSATSLFATFAAVFRDALDAYQLVVFDQRGTGRSGPLDCAGFHDRPSSSQIAGCATSLGKAADFYTTADSVLDLDDVRTALGTDRLVLAGVSYGTHVALEYERTFPRHVSAIILDSTLRPDGLDSFDRPSLSAAGRVIGDLCAGDTCRAFTRNPVGDTHTLVRRLGHPLVGVVIGPDGKRMKRTLDSAGVFDILRAGDLFPALQAGYVGAVAAARHGDLAPLLRLAVLRAIVGVGVAEDIDPRLRGDSLALHIATICSDTRFPWNEADPFDVRLRLFQGAVQAVSPADLFPFDRNTALREGAAPACLYWPPTSLVRASSQGAFPDVPALVLGGTRDVRTPIENSEAVATVFPRAVRVVIPHYGHSVLTASTCARMAATAFLKKGHVEDPCDALAAPFRASPPPPRSLLRVAPVPAIGGLPGRIVAAVALTLNDAATAAYSVLSSAHNPIDLGGLRAGKLRASFTSEQVGIELTRYAAVPGVVLTGTMTLTQTNAFARVHVQGRMVGDLDLSSTGAVSGKLGRRSIAVAGRAWVPPAPGRGGAFEPALPPIP